MEKGISLVELLIVVGLMTILFFGIFGAYQLGMFVIGLSSRKTMATQIALGELEKIKNLPYLSVGTTDATLPFAKGILAPRETKILNGIEFQIERKIKFISDEADGLGSEDSCNLDYKRVQIIVSWGGRFSGKVELTSDISPKNSTEEIQACEGNPVGILRVQVFDALGNMIESPLIEIYNPQDNSLVDFATPSDGKHDFPLSPGEYRILVSKNGYSNERTYSNDEVAIPEKPNPQISENEVEQISFSIDKLSSMKIKTLTTWTQDYFSDTFLNESKISEKNNITISDGKAELSTTSEGYYSEGNLISIEISPQNLTEWGEFSFSDEKPLGTNIKYQILYPSSTEWILIPDSDLPGNSFGFDESPVNLSFLSTTTYPRIKLKANFSTQNNSLTPSLFDWQVSFRTSNPIPISNVSFDFRGEKIIGKDAEENPVYKFSTTTQTDSSGQIQIQNLEWDIYHFSNFKKDSQSLELATSSPEHPLSLSPDTNLDVSFYLEAQNSLLVSVQNSETLEPVFSAKVTILAENFEETEYTNEKGQAIFIPLSSQNYSISVEAQGYTATSTNVFVSGKTTKVVKILQIE